MIEVKCPNCDYVETKAGATEVRLHCVVGRNGTISSQLCGTRPSRPVVYPSEERRTNLDDYKEKYGYFPWE